MNMKMRRCEWSNLNFPACCQPATFTYKVPNMSWQMRKPQMHLYHCVGTLDEPIKPHQFSFANIKIHPLTWLSRSMDGNLHRLAVLLTGREAALIGSHSVRCAASRTRLPSNRAALSAGPLFVFEDSMEYSLLLHSTTTGRKLL